MIPIRLLDYSYLLLAVQKQNGGSVSHYLSFLIKSDPRLGYIVANTELGKLMVNHALSRSGEGKGRTICTWQRTSKV